MHTAATDDDLTIALAATVAVIVLGSLLRSDPTSALTLLLGGTAGALLTRWRRFDRMQRGWMTASVALCGVAGSLPLLGFVLR